MRTSRLQAKNQLQFPHQFHVLHEYPSYHGMVILLLDDSQSSQAVQPRREVGLVAGTVIDSARVPEAIGEEGTISIVADWRSAGRNWSISESLVSVRRLGQVRYERLP